MVGCTTARPAGRTERWPPGLQGQSGVISLAWLPGRPSGRLRHRCLQLALLRLGSLLGLAHKLDGSGSEGLVWAKSQISTHTGQESMDIFNIYI